MARTLTDYFTSPALFKRAIFTYQTKYIERARLPWRLDGEDGKLTAYSWAHMAFDNISGVGARDAAVGEMLRIVQTWNGEVTKANELAKYGTPSGIAPAILENDREFSDGTISLANLNETHYQPLLDYLNAVSVIKAQNTTDYAWVAVSKFLHTVNPSLFPIYDIRHVWGGLIGPKGAFRSAYSEFCNTLDKRGIPLTETMSDGEDERSHRFNANYSYFARKYMAEASPELMPYFAEWFSTMTRQAIDPYGLKSQAHTFYGLAFEVVALGAGELERR